MPAGPTHNRRPRRNGRLGLVAWTVVAIGAAVSAAGSTGDHRPGGASAVISTPQAKAVLAGRSLEALFQRLAEDRGHAPPAPMVARALRDGQPVAGAVVMLGDGSADAVTTVTTDEHGQVSLHGLEPGVYQLWAISGDESSPVLSAEVTADRSLEVHLPLRPGQSIRGQVRDDAGAPVVADIEVVPVDPGYAARQLASDATGRFEIPALTSGTWQLVARADDHVVARREITIDETSPPGELDLTLDRGAVVSGVVRNAVGAPIAGASIIVRHHDGGAVPTSAFLDASPLRSSGLRWIHPLAEKRYLPSKGSQRFGAARHGLRPAECGHGHCGIDLGWQHGTVIHAAASGTVSQVRTVSRSAAGRFVAIDHPGGLRSFYMHLSDIRFDLAPGQTIGAGEPLGTMGATGTASGPHLHFAITQEAAGRSWFIDPEPILRQAVVLPTSRSLEAWASAGASGSVMTVATTTEAVEQDEPTIITTDSFGRFTVRGVLPGRLSATAFHPLFASGHSSRITVTSGEVTSDIDITLTAGTVVHGRIMGPSGPIVGARVIAEQGSGESLRQVARVFTDHEGRYELRPLDDRINLVVSAAGYQSAERTVSLPAARNLAPNRTEHIFQLVGDQVLNADVTESRGSLSVQIFDRHTGAPLAGARVEARGPSGAKLSTSADGSGQIVLSPLAAGTWRLTAMAEGYARASTRLRVHGERRLGQAGQTARLELGRGASLSGVVRDQYGERVVGAVVAVDGTTTTTDADGRFHLGDVPTGSRTIVIEHGDLRGEESIALRPGEEIATLELRVGP